MSFDPRKQISEKFAIGAVLLGGPLAVLIIWLGKYA